MAYLSLCVSNQRTLVYIFVVAIMIRALISTFHCDVSDQRALTYLLIVTLVISAVSFIVFQGEASSEGVVDMARAFFFPGALSVLVTHWVISDEATMVFFIVT